MRSGLGCRKLEQEIVLCRRSVGSAGKGRPASWAPEVVHLADEGAVSDSREGLFGRGSRSMGQW